MSRIPKFGAMSHTAVVPETSSIENRFPLPIRPRRSKSHTGLRIRRIGEPSMSVVEQQTSNSFKNLALIKKPLSTRQIKDEVPPLPSIGRKLFSRRRRSRSTTDMRTVVERPPKSTTDSIACLVNKPQSSDNRIKGVATTSRNLPGRNNELKIGVKRGADNTEAPVKNKVPKKPKVPEWDYKTRYGLLHEKYSTLLTKHKDIEKALSEAEQKKAENVHLKTENIDLQISNKNHQKEIKNLQELMSGLNNTNKLRERRIQTLEIQISDIERNNEKLQDDFEEIKTKSENVDLENDRLKKEIDFLTDKYRSVCERIETETEHRIQLTKQIFEGEQLRRRLHNCIQDLKGNIRVFIRLRPPLTEQEQSNQSTFKFPSEKTIEITKARGAVVPTATPKFPETHEFAFDRVFDQETTQEMVFDELSHLVQSALDGYHVCVFAYGQTGSGKTFTMQGESETRLLGMIPRSINLVFKTKQEMEKKGWRYTVRASFLEIYNENVRDLLNIKSDKPLEIRFNDGKGTTVTNLTIMPISSAEELTGYMMKAHHNRSTAVTNYNEHSSRSHAVTKIYIEAIYEESNATFDGSINLVDLAGSENASQSFNERLVETKNINKSLSALGSVMLALHKKETHIPFRNSKLTYLLQSSLGGNCKCLMIVNISPCDYCESINALRFATNVKEIRIGTSRNRR